MTGGAILQAGLAPYLAALYWQLAFAVMVFVRLLSSAGAQRLQHGRR